MLYYVSRDGETKVPVARGFNKAAGHAGIHNCQSMDPLLWVASYICQDARTLRVLGASPRTVGSQPPQRGGPRCRFIAAPHLRRASACRACRATGTVTCSATKYVLHVFNRPLAVSCLLVSNGLIVGAQSPRKPYLFSSSTYSLL